MAQQNSVMGQLLAAVIVIGVGAYVYSDCEKKKAKQAEDDKQEQALEAKRIEAREADEAKAIATRMQSCRASSACEARGWCTYRPPTLVATEDISFQPDSDCYASSASDCKASGACKMLGHCTVDTSLGRCIIGGDSDCRDTRMCREQGMCTRQVEKFDSLKDAFDRMCRATTVDDCKASDAAKEGRTCPVYGLCEKPVRGKCPD